MDLRETLKRRNEEKNRWESSTIDHSTRYCYFYNEFSATTREFHFPWNIYQRRITHTGRKLDKKNFSFLTCTSIFIPIYSQSSITCTRDWNKATRVSTISPSGQSAEKDRIMSVKEDQATPFAVVRLSNVYRLTNYLCARDSRAYMQPCDYSIICTSPRRRLSLYYEKSAHNSPGLACSCVADGRSEASWSQKSMQRDGRHAPRFASK